MIASRYEAGDICILSIESTSFSCLPCVNILLREQRSLIVSCPKTDVVEALLVARDENQAPFIIEHRSTTSNDKTKPHI
jgi:hypothetical protein